jgi:magnesium chelatase family protein
VVTHLADLTRPQEIPARTLEELPERPMEFVRRQFSRSQARLLEILAVGEHSALLAGPAGSGKTTVAQSLAGFLREPSLNEFRKLKKIHQEFGSALHWRPTVKPHHSTPTMAMIGGGSVPFAGEISRAHGGILILDEMLEFHPAVQEALREPFEEGKIRVCRNGKFKDFPAEALIVATTNLCPCGKWTPVLKDSKVCSFSNVRCQSYRHRLSGPLIDRFEILEFTNGIGNLEVDGESLLKRVRQAQDFSRSLQKEDVKNSRKSFESLVKNLFSHQLQYANLDQQTSQRRKLAVLRVARTLADLDLSEMIRREHLDEAVIRCQVHFQKLLNWN